MDKRKINSTEALELLLEGNKRFVDGVRSIESFATPRRLQELADKGQSPFAIVLTCSDSRVPAEIIFDRGLGDLFMIRIAGNVISPSVIGSVEFAATNFGTPLCVVMGHSMCGAVKAAVSAEKEGTVRDLSHIGKIVQKVRPSVRTAIRTLGRPIEELSFEKLLHQTTIENTRHSAEALFLKSPILQGLISDRKLLITSAIYDLHTGKVEFEQVQEQTMQARRNTR
jgi:carbonic anhydrase